MQFCYCSIRLEPNTHLWGYIINYPWTFVLLILFGSHPLAERTDRADQTSIKCSLSKLHILLTSQKCVIIIACTVFTLFIQLAYSFCMGKRQNVATNQYEIFYHVLLCSCFTGNIWRVSQLLFRSECFYRQGLLFRTRHETGLETLETFYSLELHSRNHLIKTVCLSSTRILQSNFSMASHQIIILSLSAFVVLMYLCIMCFLNVWSLCLCLDKT